MANRRHNKQVAPSQSGGGHSVNHRGPSTQPMPERTARWPGLPGKTQPRDRGGGVKKCKCHPSSEGI